MVSLPGSILKAALEHSVSLCGLDPNEGCDGQFLQLSSGFRVVYDLTQPAGSRLVSARVRIGEDAEVGSGLGKELQEEEGDKSEEFQEVEDDTVYQVVTTDYLLEGGDGYKLVGVEEAQQGRLETDVLREYFGQSDAAVRSEVEGRIMFCDRDC